MGLVYFHTRINSGFRSAGVWANVAGPLATGMWDAGD